MPEETVVELVPRTARSLLLQITIEGEPRPKPRPRVTRRGTFTPRTAKSFEEMVEWRMRALCPEPTKRHVMIEVDFYLSNHRRCDLDNLVKLITDAGNCVVWWDDSQIVELFARKRVDKPPRTEIRAWEIYE